MPGDRAATILTPHPNPRHHHQPFTSQTPTPGFSVWYSRLLFFFFFGLYHNQKCPSLPFFFCLFVCFLINLFIYLFIYGCVGSSFLRGPSLVAASGGHSLSRCAGFSLSRPLPLWSTGSRRSLSSCGSRAQLLRGMWDLPRPGLKPVSPALAGRLSTTAPPGKPL